MPGDDQSPRVVACRFPGVPVCQELRCRLQNLAPLVSRAVDGLPRCDLSAVCLHNSGAIDYRYLVAESSQSTKKLLAWRERSDGWDTPPRLISKSLLHRALRQPAEAKHK